MALAVAPPNDRKRVKVYELRDNDWFDRGTGFCTGQILDVSLDAIVMNAQLASLRSGARLRDPATGVSRRPSASSPALC